MVNHGKSVSDMMADKEAELARLRAEATRYRDALVSMERILNTYIAEGGERVTIPIRSLVKLSTIAQAALKGGRE